ncbi:MAG: PDZ domain-containing protein, partial [Deinococcus sp.]|nr:PDZ domain-containing protein [Deinococcus sp.]
SLDLAVTLGGIADVEPSPPGAPGTPGPRTGLGVPPPQAAPPQESQPQPRAFLGIQGRDITAELTQSFRFPVQSGVLIESVEPGSPAEQAGLRGGNITARFGGEEIRLGGDIIVQLDGQAVTSIAQLDELIAAYRPGDRITLTVLRSNRRVEVQVTLGEAR